MIFSSSKSTMLLIGTALLASLLPAQDCGASLVGVGDIAFVRFNADGTDDLAIVLLADADVGQQVSFNNNPFSSQYGKFGANREHFVWNIDQTLAAGTVVTFSNLSNGISGGVASHGVIDGKAMLTMQLSDTADTVYAYLGDDALTPGTFLAAISTANSGVLMGTNLIAGDTAVILTSSADEAHYAGSRNTATAFSDYRPLIGNVGSNWQVRTNDNISLPAFDTTDFQLAGGASTPESPRIILLALIGMLLCMKLASVRPMSVRA